MNKDWHSNRFSSYILIIIVGIIVFYLWYLDKSPYFLEFIPENKKESLLKLRIYPGDEFTISYIHSYNKTPVYETFLIDNDYDIILKETGYEWQGIGLQDTCPIEGVWGYKDGNICISEINKKLDNIPLRVGTIAEHSLTFKNKTIPFLSFAKGGELVNIKVKRHLY